MAVTTEATRAQIRREGIDDLSLRISDDEYFYLSCLRGCFGKHSLRDRVVYVL